MKYKGYIIYRVYAPYCGNSLPLLCTTCALDCDRRGRLIFTRPRPAVNQITGTMTGSHQIHTRRGNYRYMDVLQAPIHPQAGAYRDTVVRAQGLPTLPQIDSKGHPIRGAGAADHCGTRHREQIRDDLRRVYVTNSIEFTDSGKRYQIRKPRPPVDLYRDPGTGATQWKN